MVRECLSSATVEAVAWIDAVPDNVVVDPVASIFLPGILMPTFLRYGPLRGELGDTRATFTKELEVYAAAAAPADYSIGVEVDGLDRFADEHGLDRFHLYGHSAGGAIALAYAAAHPQRLLSLALDEPASDFSDEDRRAIDQDLPSDLDDLPVPERMIRFTRSMLRPGIEAPTMAPPADNPEMAKRPAGLSAFRRALTSFRLDLDALRSFAGPAYYSYGSLSNERWEAIAERLQRVLPRCIVERYDGIHHINTSHQAEPRRVAAALERLWSDAERT